MAWADSYSETVATVRGQLPRDFIVERSGNFVLASDLGPERYRAVRDQTLHPAERALSALFFDTPPSRPIIVYLFEGRESYERWAAALFGGSRPSTPYGFFRASENALVMNIATGGGTLVHELTHALMEPDFPDCPPWLFEGLGSLFEQSQFADGGIRGLVNWRLPVLRRGLRDGEVLHLKDLMELTPAEFYGEGSGVHYAQARYVLMYLQQRGQLTRFYRTARDARRQDPGGSRSFQAVTGISLAEFERKWLRWVDTL